MIVKNEERDLPKCLDSIKSVVDGLVIIDTGSTDNTKEAAVTTWPLSLPLIYETYTGASEKDETGDWKLWNFSQARNQFLNVIETFPEVDYVIWMDADDTLVSPPQNLRRALYLSGYTVFGMMVESGDKWVHHRMWKTKRGIRFAGAIHEYPVIGGHPEFILSDTVIHHDPTPCIGENSNARNLRILLKEAEEGPSSRNLFYLANTYKDAQNWAPAIEYYGKRIAFGEVYRDEWLFAYLYKARCERANGDAVAAEKTMLEALSKEPGWSEFWMEMSYMFMSQGKIQEAMGMALMASSKTPAPTALWRENNKYTDQPLRTLSFCSEYIGDAVNALAWAQKAKTAIGVTDIEWDERIARLETQLGTKRQIVLVRPGAIGDIIMTLNCIPQLKKLYPEHDILYYCNKFIGDSLRPLMHLAGVDKVCDYNSEVIDYAKADKVVNLVGYPVETENYPNQPMSKHLIDYFAAEMGCLDSIYPLNIKLDKEVGLPSQYATIHPKAGWSNYKNWENSNWAQVIASNPDIPFFQIGAAGDPLIPGADHRFVGTPLMTGLSVIANATMHVGVDSFSNHATYVFSVPAIILWGSTQWSAAGYPNNINISLGLDCQPCFKEAPHMTIHPKGICDNPPGQVYDAPCHACMAGISVEQVDEAVKTLWTKSIRSKR
jgi:tetratricopeptide (TPR) repeat protein